MGNMDEQNVFRHLLEVEGQAAALIDEAQAEADRRLAEAERRSQARYKEQYGKEAARLDEEYAQQLIAITEAYNSQLDEYQQSLESMIVNPAQFRTLLNSYIIEEYRAATGLTGVDPVFNANS